MDHLDASGVTVHVHQRVEPRVITFTHHDRRAESELGERRSQKLERAHVGTHEHDSSTEGQALFQYLPILRRHQDPLPCPEFRPPQKQGECQVLARLHEGRPCYGFRTGFEAHPAECSFGVPTRSAEDSVGNSAREAAKPEKQPRGQAIGDRERPVHPPVDERVLDALSAVPTLAQTLIAKPRHTHSHLLDGAVFSIT
jgi:hypothetical protein